MDGSDLRTMKHPTCEKLDRLTSQLQVFSCADLGPTWVKYVHVLLINSRLVPFLGLTSTGIRGVGAVATRIPQNYI